MDDGHLHLPVPRASRRTPAPAIAGAHQPDDRPRLMPMVTPPIGATSLTRLFRMIGLSGVDPGMILITPPSATPATAEAIVGRDGRNRLR